MAINVHLFFLVYVQDPVKLLDTYLPLPLSCLPDILRVVFVGKNFDRSKAVSVLAISRQRVRTALQWLVKHHPLYNAISINEDILSTYPDDDTQICDEVWALISKTGESGNNVDTEGKGYVPDVLDNNDGSGSDDNDEDNVDFGVDAINFPHNKRDAEPSASDNGGERMDAIHAAGVFGVDGITSARQIFSNAGKVFNKAIGRQQFGFDGDDMDQPLIAESMSIGEDPLYLDSEFDAAGADSAICDHMDELPVLCTCSYLTLKLCIVVILFAGRRERERIRWDLPQQI